MDQSAEIRPLTDDEIEETSGGVNKVVVRVVAKAIVAAVTWAIKHDKPGGSWTNEVTPPLGT